MSVPLFASTPKSPLANEPLRVLLIDDEVAIRNVLQQSLSREGARIAEAETGAVGLELAESFHPHLILLDLGLPDMNGAEVLSRLRAWTTVPVLILSVADDQKTIVDLLDAGADDYLTKPFGVDELLARIRVCLRNRRMVEATPIFESGDLRVDLNQEIVEVSGQPVKLTSTEFELLKLLARERGQIVSQQKILQQVWHLSDTEQLHYVRIYIKQLRKKIEAQPSEPVHILTEAGVGYRLV